MESRVTEPIMGYPTDIPHLDESMADQNAVMSTEVWYRKSNSTSERLPIVSTNTSDRDVVHALYFPETMGREDRFKAVAALLLKLVRSEDTFKEYLEDVEKLSHDPNGGMFNRGYKHLIDPETFIFASRGENLSLHFKNSYAVLRSIF